MFHDEQPQQKNHTFTITPKLSFIAGLVTSVLGLATIGFVILLVSVLRGGSGSFTLSALSASNPTTTRPSVAAQAPITAPPPASAPTGTVKPVSRADHIRGDQNAKVFVIEYADLECPYCRLFHPTMQQLMSQYQGKVAWVYRHFPLSFHQNAEKEAEATECANELGGNDAFWKYVDTIFQRTTSNGTGFPLNGLVPLAKEIGLDETKFKSCLDSGKYTQRVQQDEQDGTVAGVTGTPGNIIWTSSGKSQLVEGAVPYDQLKAAVDSFLR